ncbi:hypothetical protein VTJ83DRAFT_7094 [Remersonia thermophila]|uniref:Peptidase A1 domain-containing protein n=1 Tax=Remersonia thermophila TaxID=72144 RepID=A0ABR4D4R9_9PEZI
MLLPVLASASLLSLALAPGATALVARGDGIVRAAVRAIPDLEPLPKLRSRQNVLDVINQRNGTRYAVEVAVGTPPQTQYLILDTGSPNTWFNPTCETSRVVEECMRYPRFDLSKSSSLRNLRASGLLLYGSGQAEIDWYSDTLKIGSATIKDQVIGVNVQSERIPLGILGVSPPLSGVNEYPYVLDSMVSQGLIKSRAFSLDLRGVDNPNGAIIFGGIDTGKYIGSFAKLPILPQSQSPRGGSRYYVHMNAVGLTLPDGTVLKSEELQTPVFLDSGATLSYLPTRIFEALANSFEGGAYEPDTGFYYLPCSATNLNGTIDFYFGDKVIRVALNDFIWQAGRYCLLGAVAEEREPVLGATFLRAAYVVFDQDQKNLHIAQGANCGENLVAIGSGKDAVPSRTGDCTELPTPTGTAASSRLDATRTNLPTMTFTGAVPTFDNGPGPAADPTSSGTLPLGSDVGNVAGKGVQVSLGVAAAVVAANLVLAL